MKFVRIVLGLMFTAFLAACGGGGGSAGANPNAGALRTSAGDSVVIAPGETRAYTISGGVAPYSVRNGDPAIALGSVAGAQLTIQAKGIGSTTVEVVDNGGTATSISVRIGSSTPVSVTAPSSVSLNLGPSSAQTYDVRGGVAPYTVVSSDPRIVGVYFDPATLKLTVTGLAVGGATVSVRDGANETTSFTVSTAPAQNLSVAAPPSLVLAVSGTQTYKILGGVKPYQVSSSNPAVLAATKQFEDDLVLRGVAGGTATVTVGDIAGGVTTLSVRVGSANALFTTAPATLTLATSESSPTFAISGGSAPYSVVSSNSAIAAVTFTGASFSVTGGTLAGSAPVVITDSIGTRIQVAVTVTAPGGGSTALVPAATVEVLTSSNTLQSGGTSVDITAFVKNALNVTMPNEPVSFSADSGLLQNATPTTDANGKASAKLLVGNDKSNRTIRVTVRSGTASGFVNVAITGTRVVLTGDGAVQQQATAVYSARVLDSSNNPISNTVVTFTSTLLNSFNPGSNITDALGVTTSTYTATNPGTAKLTASALGATSDALDVVISNVVLRFVPFNEAGNLPYSDPLFFGPGPQSSDVVLGDSQRLVLEYRIVGNPSPDTPTVSFTTTRGRFQPSGLSSITTSSWSAVQTSGARLLVVNLEAINPDGNSPGAGPVTIAANIAGVAEASLGMNFLAQTPASLALQANPSSVPPNTGGSSLSQSTLQATVRDGAGNLVSGRLVNFNIVSDISGGRLSSATALTDANGRALVQYIAGAATTGVNDVRVRASVEGFPTVFGDAALTVSGQALFINLAYSNTIGNVPGNPSVYAKPFSVYVTDATGNPVGNQSVVLSVIPLAYKTGDMSLNGEIWVPNVTATCKNTDFNFNGVLDGLEPSVLRPGNVVSAPSSLVTDGTGQATFDLTYGEQFAPWVIVKVVARATVAGTESVRESIYTLEGSVEDFQSAGGPAGNPSPFGASAPAPYAYNPAAIPPTPAITGECVAYP